MILSLSTYLIATLLGNVLSLSRVRSDTATPTDRAEKTIRMVIQFGARACDTRSIPDLLWSAHGVRVAAELENVKKRGTALPGYVV